MPLHLNIESQHIGDVAIVRCRGRIVAGEEMRSLQQELEKLAEETKQIVLHLAEVSYLDSGGLGGIVRFLGVLRGARGDLKLCQLSPFVHRVLRATNVHSVFETYDSEGEAIEAFCGHRRSPAERPRASATRILCVDASCDLLAYLNALLQRAGYEVFTARNLSDVRTLLKATRPGIVIIGPGLQTNEPPGEVFQRVDRKVQLLFLPADFSTAEASQAGLDLVNRIRSLLEV